MSHEQMHMFPESLPLIVKRIWAAKLKHDGTKTKDPFTIERCEDLLKRDGSGGPWSISTISRECRKHARFLPWNLLKTRGARPPWEPHPELLETPVDEQPVSPASEDSADLPLDHWMLQHPVDGHLVVDKNGIVRAVVRNVQKLTVLAAGFCGATMLLDVASDGKLDHVIVWCRLLLQPILKR